MANCEYYQELMSRLMDEGLTAEEEAELREHVRACPDCARVLAAFSGITVALREDLAEPPEALAGIVMTRIAAAAQPEIEPDDDGEPEAETVAEEPVHIRHVQKPKKRPAPWIRIGAAACLVLLAGGAAFSVFRGHMGDKMSSSAQSADAGAMVNGTAEVAEYEMAADYAMPADGPRAAAGFLDPLEVLDIAGSPIGYIPGADITAFAAFLEDDGVSNTSWEMLCTVQYDGKTYAFGTDDGASSLAWWDTADGTAHLSPGTWPSLRALIISTVNTEAGE